MSPLPLDQAPAKADIFIDANIFVYGLSEESAQCRDFLRRCSTEELTDICLFETVNEATHVFMRAEAQAKGLISKSNPAKQLRQNFGVVKNLDQYWNKTLQILSLNLLFLPLDQEILLGAQKERAGSGLLTNDSMLIGCMRAYGITALATSDVDFERVPGIVVYGPGDITI
ncbi:MAG TPA: type II toxin-antitoxin system VapC family toxin [Blastocatellia bacterium]